MQEPWLVENLMYWTEDASHIRCVQFILFPYFYVCPFPLLNLSMVVNVMSIHRLEGLECGCTAWDIITLCEPVMKLHHLSDSPKWQNFAWRANVGPTRRKRFGKGMLRTLHYTQNCSEVVWISQTWQHGNCKEDLDGALKGRKDQTSPC